MRTGLAMALLCAACGAEVEDERTERFVGFWFVEETEPHALYSASSYELSAVGEVALAWDAGYYGSPHGQVRSADGQLACQFGERWRSEGTETLIVDGDCSDGHAREIVLAFTNPPATNAEGADVEIVSVGGEGGWRPPVWGWSFTWCAELCLPDWVD
jgi:hypothetical protein